MKKTSTIKELVNDLLTLTSFKVVLFMLLLLIVLMFLTPTDNIICQNILAGLFSGFIITGFHVFVDYKNLQLKRLVSISKLEDLLINRNSKEYYQKLLESTHKRLYVMGTSCTRLLSDFGSISDNGIIDTLLKKGVEIRLLVIEGDKISTTEQFKIYIKKKKFEVKKFNQAKHSPQSIFIIDDRYILGSIFTGRDSKDTAALRFFGSSEYTKQYEQYFDTVWESSEPIPLEENHAKSAS